MRVQVTVYQGHGQTTDLISVAFIVHIWNAVERGQDIYRANCECVLNVDTLLFYF